MAIRSNSSSCEPNSVRRITDPFVSARVAATAVVLAQACFLMAQTDLDVHVSPRISKAKTAVGMSVVDSGGVLRSNVDLVLVGVTVLDRDDRAVAGLQP